MPSHSSVSRKGRAGDRRCRQGCPALGSNRLPSFIPHDRGSSRPSRWGASSRGLAKVMLICCLSLTTSDKMEISTLRVDLENGKTIKPWNKTNGDCLGEKFPEVRILGRHKVWWPVHEMTPGSFKAFPDPDTFYQIGRCQRVFVALEPRKC